jgi:membrane-bound lytic murein transglycosylase
MSARRLLLLLGLAAVGWALALLRPAAEPLAPAANADESDARATAAPAPSPKPKPTAAESAMLAEQAQARARAAEAAAAEDAERLARQERLADEGNHRHDQRFDSAVERWQQEKSKPRQEPWATRREHALRRAMDADGLAQLAQRIECRATLCRIQLAASGDQTALKIRRGHRFMREVGFQTAGAFAGEGEKRLMVLYVAREGTQL